MILRSSPVTKVDLRNSRRMFCKLWNKSRGKEGISAELLKA